MLLEQKKIDIYYYLCRCNSSAFCRRDGVPPMVNKKSYCTFQCQFCARNSTQYSTSVEMLWNYTVGHKCVNCSLNFFFFSTIMITVRWQDMSIDKSQIALPFSQNWNWAHCFYPTCNQPNKICLNEFGDFWPVKQTNWALHQLKIRKATGKRQKIFWRMVCFCWIICIIAAIQNMTNDSGLVLINWMEYSCRIVALTLITASCWFTFSTKKVSPLSHQLKIYNKMMWMSNILQTHIIWITWTFFFVCRIQLSHTWMPHDQ